MTPTVQLHCPINAQIGSVDNQSDSIIVLINTCIAIWADQVRGKSVLRKFSYHPFFTLTHCAFGVKVPVIAVPVFSFQLE